MVNRRAWAPVCLQGREKIHLIHLFTKMGFSVLLSDVDTVWLRNPLPYMKQARHGKRGPGGALLVGLCRHRQHAALPTAITRCGAFCPPVLSPAVSRCRRPHVL